MIKNIKNVRLNTAGIAEVILNPFVFVIAAMATMMTVIIKSEIAKDEEKKIAEEQAQIVENLISSESEDQKYTIINGNVVRLEEDDAKWDFHFASGQAFVVYSGHNHKNETDSIPFSELNTNWIKHALDTGCSISQELINTPPERQITDEDLTEKLQNAQNFHGAHCAPNQ